MKVKKVLYNLNALDEVFLDEVFEDNFSYLPDDVFKNILNLKFLRRIKSRSK